MTSLESAQSPERVPWLAASVVFLLTLALHLPYLQIGPLAGTEGHRALTADQMVRSGQWVVPMLYGRLYLAKPPLHHWLIAIAQTLAGRGNEFVWRIPSVLVGGLLNAAVVLFAARWFGRSAGWLAGGLGMGLICLWAQQQSADIDATNTLVSAVAAMGWVELLFRSPAKRLRWSLLTGTAFGASLMVKGPAGLPVILGPILLALVIRIQRWRAGRSAVSGGVGFDVLQNASSLPLDPSAPPLQHDSQEPPPQPSPGVPGVGVHEVAAKGPTFNAYTLWLPLLVGVMIFAGWILAAYFRVRSLGLAIDYWGVREGGKNLAPNSLARFAQALLIGPMMFAWTLPVSLALVFLLFPKVRASLAAKDRGLILVLAGSTITSWIVCTASGMINPRYAYVTLPPLAILAAGLLTNLWRGGDQGIGDLSAAIARKNDGEKAIRLIILLTAIGLAIGGVVTALVAVRAIRHNSTIATAAWIAAGVGVGFAVFISLWLRSGRPIKYAACPLALLLICVSVPYGHWRNGTRWQASGAIGAKTLRSVVGDGVHIETGTALTFQPEIFHYAGVDALAHPLKEFSPETVQRPTWLLLTPSELKHWRRLVGDRLGKETAVESNGSNKNYVVWYAGPASSPATRP